ncbi:MAG: hypothetical protein H6623_07465 [Bdellovibrionaceae bacterium]|nr:hypothetical protein [Pseudobdellovibrionaceae bacterium]
MRVVVFLFLLLLSVEGVHAFPEMIRFGYTSCTACHVSPAGGGLTTAYGRSISKELLSRWSYEGEENLAHGAIGNENTLSWLNGSRDRGFNVGGDLRFLQTRVDTSQFTQGRAFPMQRDLEFSAKYDQFSLTTSYGIIYSANDKDQINLRRTYLTWNINDNILVRAGRFIPVYGIMSSDHYLAIKQNLLLGQLTERNTVESHFTYENWSASLSYSKAPPSKTNLDGELAATGTLNYNINETMRVGVNYWYGHYKEKKRDITGINALLGYTKKFYSLSEIDLQTNLPYGGAKTKGLYYFHRFGYEVTRGLHLLAQIDGSQSDVNASNTKYYAFGSGITFYPRPHFELQLMWTRPKYVGVAFSDAAFLVFHYYL